jgi:hypothetical protein
MVAADEEEEEAEVLGLCRSVNLQGSPPKKSLALSSEFAFWATVGLGLLHWGAFCK